MGLCPTFFLAFEFGERRQCILYTLKVIKDDRSSPKLVVSKMGILAQTSNFQNCIKKTNKIPEYAGNLRMNIFL